MRKIKCITILQEKKPGLIVVIAIALFNVIFLALFSLALSLMNGMPYFEAAFNCVAIVFDPGCISGVVDGRGEALLCIVCFIIAVFGLIFFSGAIIGYVSNAISSFIENANNGHNKLDLSDHTVILNWNDRALEILNEYLLLGKKKVIVVLSSNDRDLIQKQIKDTLSVTVRDKKIKNHLSVIVRQGSVFSSQQLLDVSLENASTIIILEEASENVEDGGNGLTIKTLMQVSDITSKHTNCPKQKVIVEVSDDWTQAIIKEILSSKVNTHAEIVAVPVNELFGNIFTQFAIIPKLNNAYSELFSNEGVEFFSNETDFTSESNFVLSYINNHSHAIPLTIRKENRSFFAFYLGAEEKDISFLCDKPPVLRELRLSNVRTRTKDKIIILGHNKNLENILAGIHQYNSECAAYSHAIRVILMDEQDNLEKHDFYKAYPFVEKCVPVGIHQRDLILSQLCENIDGSNLTVLILSQDNSGEGKKDLYALANLIYLRSALKKKSSESDFDSSSVDVVVEIIDPKHHDIVQNYSQSNVIISNRYVSKMMMQLAEKEGLYGFYKDILTFDSDGQEGKEIYLKRTDDYFAELPEPMPVRDFVYSLFKTTLDLRGSGEVALGWIDSKNNISFFHGDMTTETISLDKGSQLIVLSDH